MDITIRVVDDSASCRAVEELQLQIWGFQALEVVPYHQLMTAAQWGGIVLVAYDGDEPVGFAYGFPGLDRGRPVLCSHMLGVLPAYRSRQVGYRLKLAQRDAARRAGYDRMVWTFDPLESRNAYLNLHKLGAFVETYSIDHYGDMDDDLNRGLPSDRLLADWRFGGDTGVDPGAGTTARAPVPPGAGEAAPVLNPAVIEAGLAHPGRFQGTALGSAPVVRVAVPGDAGRLRREAPDAALAWRFSVREALTAAFAGGYRAVDFVPPRGTAVAYYILTRNTPEGDTR